VNEDNHFLRSPFEKLGLTSALFPLRVKRTAKGSSRIEDRREQNVGLCLEKKAAKSVAGEARPKPGLHGGLDN
jgi:hypothetical protein